jgi:sugar phosphate isomerase/epimerase
MNRRRFVRGAGAVATSALVYGCGTRTEQARAADCTRPPGVQLYAVRDALRRDPRGTLARLRAIGFREAELWNLDSGAASSLLFDLPAPDFKAALDANGIAVPLSHVGGALTNVPAISELAHALGIGTLVVALPSEFSRTDDGRFSRVGAQSLEQMARLAERLNQAGRDYRANGLGFGYHNHHIEFLEVEETVPFEYLMANTDPELVKIELDVGWLAVAGVDPVEYLHRYAGRVIGCHLKDYAPALETDTLDRKLVEPGAGTIDFGAVLAAMDETGVAHGFVEIDVSDDPLGAVRRGHEHLEELRACG